MKLSKTFHYSKVEKKFFKKHKDLISKYSNVLNQLKNDPFDKTLKTHKLKGDLKDFYSCSLTYSYRIIITIKIVDEEIILVNIGTHDNVY